MPTTSDTLGIFNHEPELAAIFQQPVIKRFGVVECEEKPNKGYYRHEVLKIYMRRNYPTTTMRSDLVDSLNVRMSFNIKPYFKHPKVNKEENMKKARSYLQNLEMNPGFRKYLDRHRSYENYTYVIKRMHDNLKKYIRELKLMYKKSDHIHFLHEILFVKNLRSYPLPRRWIALIAIHGNSVFLERILAAIRVVTDYDGDSAPEFNFDLF